jgi:hypothetical protein
MTTSRIATAHARTPAEANAQLTAINLLFQERVYMTCSRFRVACPQRHRICTLAIAFGVPQQGQKV